MAYRILIAEDDAGLNEGIRLAIKQNDIVFFSAYSIQEAKELLDKEHPDMVLLDIQFPDGSGFDFLRELRRTSQIPVLVITANDMELDEVKGLTLGADDYITKPFSLMALRARVENVRKRTTNAGAWIYEQDGYRFDFEKMDFRLDGQEITLSITEQKLLKLLVTNPGQILTREMLVERIWTDGTEYVEESALSVTVSRLRKKLERKGEISPVRTAYGIGYVWMLERNV